MARKNIKWQVNEAVMDSELPPPARLLMFVFSDLADAKTGVIPEDRKEGTSLKELARRTGLGPATVKRHKPDLVTLGWLKYDEPTGKQQSSHETGTYTIAVGRNPEPEAQSEPPTQAQNEPPEDIRENAPGAQSEPPGGSERATGEAQSEPPIKGIPTPTSTTDIQASAACAADPPVAKSKRARKPAKPKPADPLGDLAQELTVAFVEAHPANVQPFVAIRGVVKTALGRNVPRDVLATALSAVAANGYAISGNTLTFELNRMWNAANGKPQAGHRPNAAEQRMAQSRQVIDEMRRLDEAEAAGYQPPILFALPPGRSA